MREISLMGNKVSAITVEELNREIGAIIDAGEREPVLNTNIHGMNLAARMPWLKEFRNSARIVHCDGVGVMLGARVLGLRIPERITFGDWVPLLAGFAAARNYTFYFLGAKPGVAERAAERLRAQHPGVKIVGIHHGFFEKEGPECDAVVAEINRLRPNIVIVGFGMPAQELWIRDNWRRIDANVFLAGGGCFDIISGDLPRAPAWLAEYGFEWLWLSIIRPRRFLGRYLFGNPAFLFRVLAEKLSSPKAREAKQPTFKP
ncbi:MAG: WecB/TagA/CpsF family glycosyltransferase [Gemmatimonadota bacterium]